MQNGFYDHTGRYVLIREGGGWDAGGRANPAPFWMSSKGYGALRNTYKPGSYNFSKTAPLSRENFFFRKRSPNCTGGLGGNRSNLVLFR